MKPMSKLRREAIMIRRYCCFIIVESSYNGDKKRQKNTKTTHCVKGLCYNNKCLEEQDTTLIKELRRGS